MTDNPAQEAIRAQDWVRLHALVSEHCTTPTQWRGDDMLGDWLAQGEYTGAETAESIAAEWDALSAEIDATPAENHEMGGMVDIEIRLADKSYIDVEERYGNVWLVIMAGPIMYSLKDEGHPTGFSAVELALLRGATRKRARPCAPESVGLEAFAGLWNGESGARHVTWDKVNEIRAALRDLSGPLIPEE